MPVTGKPVLNQPVPIPGFRDASVRRGAGPGAVEVWGGIEAHAQRRGRGSVCAQAAATSDHLTRREGTHGGLWGLRVRPFSPPRRRVAEDLVAEAASDADDDLCSPLHREALNSQRRRPFLVLRPSHPAAIAQQADTPTK